MEITSGPLIRHIQQKRRQRMPGSAGIVRASRAHGAEAVRMVVGCAEMADDVVLGTELERVAASNLGVVALVLPRVARARETDSLAAAEILRNTDVWDEGCSATEAPSEIGIPADRGNEIRRDVDERIARIALDVGPREGKRHDAGRVKGMHPVRGHIQIVNVHKTRKALAPSRTDIVIVLSAVAYIGGIGFAEVMVDTSGQLILIQSRASGIALVEVTEVGAEVDRRGHRLVQVVEEPLV